MTIWILVTDGERLRIVEIGDPDGAPREVDVNGLVEAVTQAVAMRDPSLLDNQRSMQRGNVMVNADPVMANFTHMTSGLLEQAQRLDLFDQLVVIAPPGIFDLLIGILSREVRESLILELEADLMDADSGVIRASLPI
ncbi:MAG: host attachment protein [Granulosicoccaceae bacterium]